MKLGIQTPQQSTMAKDDTAEGYFLEEIEINDFPMQVGMVWYKDYIK